MPIEQKQFDINIFKGFSSISELLKDVEKEINANDYGQGRYLKSINRVTQGQYQIVVERQIP